MKLRLVIALIAFAMVSTLATSCSKDKVDTETNVDAQTDTEAEAEVPKDPNELELPEDLDIEGETFNLYVALSTLKNSYISEELTGTSITNDAVFERNEAVKNHLGIDLNFVASTLSTGGADQQTETSKISSLILAGDTTYDAFVHVQHTGMPTLINEGMFIDWNEIPIINLEKPWWYSNALRDITFGDKIFCMTGDYNLNTFQETAILIFNKGLMDELELDYPYQLVQDGTWTHDRFVEYIQTATKDLNGDGQMTNETDRYGFYGWKYEQLPALYVGYDGVTLKKDDNNMPVLNIYSEHQNKVIDAMIEVFSNEGAVFEGSTWSKFRTPFLEGRLLFVDGFFNHLGGYKDLETDFGFVPYPKLDETQDEYHSRTANISGLTYIPVTLAPERYELVGAALETMAYYSSKLVLPKYFDIVLTIKSTRDIESEQMIPIIKDSARFMDQAIGFSPDSIVASGHNTLASFWMSSRTTYEEKLKTLIETYTD